MPDVKITDNSDKVKQELQESISKVLEEWGLTAEGYAKRLCPVDTGRLRNSISHDKDDKSAYIGTNVEYAPFVELGSSKSREHPYLRPAVEDHASTYSKIAKQILGGG